MTRPAPLRRRRPFGARLARILLLAIAAWAVVLGLVAWLLLGSARLLLFNNCHIWKALS